MQPITDINSFSEGWEIWIYPQRHPLRMVVQLLFLGTGGGRFATIYQTRSTGGFVLRDGCTLHVDPGPGALSNMRRAGVDPASTDAILISHCHPDHYSDAEVLVEGMTGGGIRKRGLLAGSQSVLQGIEGMGPGVSRYHQSLLPAVQTINAGSSIDIQGMRVDLTPTSHTDPSGVGMVFHTREGRISYVGDTHLRQEVMDAHRGCRVLMLSVTRPSNARVRCHLCTEDAIEFVNAVRPEVAVITHMGVRMIQAGPEKEAAKVFQETGVRTVAAQDLMVMKMGKRITFGKYS